MRAWSSRLPLVILASIGATLLLTVALTSWRAPTDEYAYWLAGERLAHGMPLYDAAASPGTPYAYFYPPPLAQFLAPLTTVMSGTVYISVYTALLLLALWWLAGRDVLTALALIAYLPVAVELSLRNIHLLIAVLLVLAIRRAPWLFAIGAAIKLAPGIGVIYLVARARWRDALTTCALGAAILVASVLLAPEAWRQFILIVGAGNVGSQAGILPVPYLARAIVAAVLAFIAGRLDPRYGEPLLVVAVTIGNPSFWVTGLSLLVAIVPLLRTGTSTGSNQVATSSAPSETADPSGADRERSSIPGSPESSRDTG